MLHAQPDLNFTATNLNDFNHKEMSQSPDYFRLLVRHADLYQLALPGFMPVDLQPREYYCFYMGNETGTAHPYPDVLNEVARMMLILVLVNRPLPYDL